MLNTILKNNYEERILTYYLHRITLLIF